MTREFLIRELRKAENQQRTPDCRIAGCHGCGVCTPKQIEELKNYPIPEKIEFLVPPRPKREFPLKRKVAVVFKKIGCARYLSLLDLTRVFTRTFRRFWVPLRYSQGFNPHPRMNIILGFPVGVEGLGELVELELSSESYDFNRFIEESRNFLPEGLEFTGWMELGLKERLIDRVDSITYRIKPAATYTLEVLKGELAVDRKGRRVNPGREIIKLEELNGEVILTLKVDSGRVLNIGDILNWMGIGFESADVVREKLLR